MFEGRKFDKLLMHKLSIASAVVGEDHTIRRYNKPFADWFAQGDDPRLRKLVGKDFYCVLRRPEIKDGCYAPFYAAAHDDSTPAERRSILKAPLSDEENAEVRTYEMLVNDVQVSSRNYFLVELRDLSKSNLFERMHETLREAGNELTELIDREFPNCTYDELIRKLAGKIKEHMWRTLKRDVCEIRTIDFSKPGRALMPFINFGLEGNAAQRTLIASATGDNGITGYVADTGNVYVCKDTHNDPYYIEGAIDARSSLTVPLVYRSQVVGVCNVESLTPNDFSGHDVVFLQLYAKDLAQAIHLLDSYRQKNDTERQRCGKIMRQTLDVMLEEALEESCALRRELEDVKREHSDSDALTRLELQLDSHVKTISNVKKTSTDMSASFLSFGEIRENPTPIVKEIPLHVPEQSFMRLVFGAQKGDYQRVCAFLQGARCLVINKRMDDPECEERWEAFLKRYGAYVDVFSSAATASEAAYLMDYDFILANKYCDHRYFADVTPEEAAQAQALPIKPTDFDIHRPGYFEATELPEASLETRKNVRKLIESGRCDDAYFFYRRLADRLIQAGRPLPFIILNTPQTSNPYDSTHVQPDMTVLRKSLLNMRVVQSEIQFNPEVQFPYLTLFNALYKELKQTEKLGEIDA